jgi:hypothetical protein
VEPSETVYRKFRISHYLFLMSLPYRSDLEEARLQLSEGLLRLWEQADLIDRLLAQGMPSENARDLLQAMQMAVGELRRQIDFLVETAERPALGPRG